MECKALDYYHNLLKNNDYDFEAIEDFLTQTNVGSSIYLETWWEDSGEHFNHTFQKDFTSREIFNMFDMYKPPNDITDEELEHKHSYNFLSYGDYAPKCQNTECEYHRGLNNYAWCGYSDWANQCIIDIVYNIQFAFEIGGWSAIDELRPQFNKKIINYICKKLPQNYVGIKEKEIYGDDDMSFVKDLSNLHKKDDISVFWENNYMYVNDESGNEAITQIDLFNAYKFGLFIEAPIFDYVASDEEVKNLQKKLLEFHKIDFSKEEQSKYLIDVWEYLDNIAEDFKKLTGVKINTIDNKRAIVSYMSETDWENNCAMGFGSATYIARLLDDTIKNANLTPSNHDKAQLLQDWLIVSDYDLTKFQEELHKEMGYKVERVIDGSIWINSAKYEYVHKIVITDEEVEIYGDYRMFDSDNVIIGNIERENIQTIVEQFYHDNGYTVTNDIKECLEFDITKKGDW